MIYIKEKRYGWDDDPPEVVDNIRCVAAGNSYENALKNLLAAINNDEVDTENCELIIIEE